MSQRWDTNQNPALSKETSMCRLKSESGRKKTKKGGNLLGGSLVAWVRVWKKKGEGAKG